MQLGVKYAGRQRRGGADVVAGVGVRVVVDLVRIWGSHGTPACPPGVEVTQAPSKTPDHPAHRGATNSAESSVRFIRVTLANS